MFKQLQFLVAPAAVSLFLTISPLTAARGPARFFNSKRKTKEKNS